jgi:hypothetical protein
MDVKRRDSASYRLYDIVADPLETTNRTRERPDVFDSLRSELVALIEASGAEAATGEATRREMSEGLSDELRALGYIE